MAISSAQRAESLIADNDPEKIKLFLNSACACMGAIEGEPLCRCKMLRREVGNRISLFALLKFGIIKHLTKRD